MELKPTEHQIQKGIMDYLKMRNILCWRNNTGAMTIIDKYGRRRYFRTGIKGLPDIFCLLPDIILMLEVKNATGRLSSDQRAFFKIARELGHSCEVCRSVDDVEEILKRFIL